MPVVNDSPLIEAPSGSDCVISRVQTHDFDKLRYIAKLGLVPGEAFTSSVCRAVQGAAAPQRPAAIDVIGYELAKSFRVEVASYGTGGTRPKS